MPSACPLSTGTSLTAPAPSRMTSSASEGPGLAGHVTDQSHLWWGGAGSRTPSHPLPGGSAVGLQVRAASSQAGGKEKLFFSATLFP